MKTPFRRRRLSRIAAGLAFVLVAALPLTAATLTVTNLNDNGPGTLRQHIADASPGDTITFAVTGTITLTNGELTIETNLSVLGPGESNLTLDASFSSRILRVAGGEVLLSGITIAHGFAGSLDPELFGDGGGILNVGSLELRHCRFMTNLAYGGGGAILNTKKLILIDSSFEGNIALAGGALFHSGMDTVTVNNTSFLGNSVDADGDGGAIGIVEGALNITNSTIAFNNAPAGNGGGIRNGGTVNMHRTRVSNNGAGDFGGGGVSNDGTVAMNESTVLNNYANLGGGVLNTGNLRITNSTLSANDAFFSGLALYNLAACTIVNSTVSAHDSQFGGGAIVSGGNLSLLNCTIYNNPRGGIASWGLNDARNCIIAGNGASDVSASFTSLGYNLIGRASGGEGFTNGVQHDQMGTAAAPLDPLLGPLQDNGGPTWTHALLPGSPALDAGHGSGLAADQRGGARAVLSTTNTPPGDRSDIGAFEVGGFVRLNSITHTNNTTHLQFTKDATTAPVPVYYVQRRAVLGTVDWADLPGPIGATNTLVPFLDSAATNAQNFYRVRMGL